MRRWELASAIPSLVHGFVTSIMATLLVAKHIRDDGAFNAGADNTAADVALLQFSCVRPSTCLYTGAGVLLCYSGGWSNRRGLYIYLHSRFAWCQPSLTLSGGLGMQAYFFHDLFVYIAIFARHELLFAVHHAVVSTCEFLSMYFARDRRDDIGMFK